MTPDAEQPTTPAPGAGPKDTGEHHVLQGRADWQQALRASILEVCAADCREVWWCDADFAEWPIGEREIVDALGRWAYAHRRLTLVAASYDRLAERHPRWVQFRRQWAHVVECRSLDSLEASQWQGLLLAPGVLTLRLFDRAHHRGSLSRRRDDAVTSREWLEALLQQSASAFPATTLGL